MDEKNRAEATLHANLIQSMLERMKNGESESELRTEFIDKFRNVDHSIIMRAEQILLDRGIAQKDLHIFFEWHGELAKSTAPITHTLTAGHPIQTLNAENLAIEKFIGGIESDLNSGNFESLPDKFVKLNEIRRHYMKKEGLIMPVLYRKGFTGPSNVMWERDDEIKRDVKNLTREVKKFFAPDIIHTSDQLGEIKSKIGATFEKIRDMITREERVFFPVALQYLSQEDWLEIYRDFGEYGYSFLDEIPIWTAGEIWYQGQDKFFEKTFEPPADYMTRGMLDGKIELPTGEITIRQLEAVLKLLPLDITFIDENDIIRFFINEGKVFPRPKSMLGRNVFECHPPKLESMLKQLLDDFKAKKRSSHEVCKYMLGKPICVKYLAVYDDRGRYIGTCEFVQNYESAIDNFKHLPI